MLDTVLVYTALCSDCYKFNTLTLNTQTHKARGQWAISADYKFIADAGQVSGFADCRRKLIPRCSEPRIITELELDQFKLGADRSNNTLFESIYILDLPCNLIVSTNIISNFLTRCFLKIISKKCYQKVF